MKQNVTLMNAVIFETFGGADVLKITKVPKPEPADQEVLIKLTHTSVNPVDSKIRLGYLQGMLPHMLPIIPGWDAAGVVEAVGRNVKNWKQGDRVVAYTRLPVVHSGTYAEFISLPETYLAKLKETVSFESAAGVPLVSLTAMQALTQYTPVRPGQKVLVLNGAGGVGSFAIQFANQLGAEVTATTSSKNVDYVQSLGAKHIIDYTKTNLSDLAKNSPAQYDFILDGIGGESLAQAWPLLKNGGQLVSIVETPSEDLAKRHGVKAVFHFVSPDGAALQAIVDGIASGATKLPAYQVRSVKDAVDAQVQSETHRTRGKVVLKIDF